MRLIVWAFWRRIRQKTEKQAVGYTCRLDLGKWTPAPLISRVSNFEDNFVQRRSSSDKRGWLKTAVAFANSLPIDYPGVLFISVRPDGTPEGIADLDSLQTAFNQTLKSAYPRSIPYQRSLPVDQNHGCPS
jgi:hypothetical protein